MKGNNDANGKNYSFKLSFAGFIVHVLSLFIVSDTADALQSNHVPMSYKFTETTIASAIIP